MDGVSPRGQEPQLRRHQHHHVYSDHPYQPLEVPATTTTVRRVITPVPSRQYGRLQAPPTQWQVSYRHGRLRQRQHPQIHRHHSNAKDKKHKQDLRHPRPPSHPRRPPPPQLPPQLLHHQRLCPLGLGTLVHPSRPHSPLLRTSPTNLPPPPSPPSVNSPSPLPVCASH